MELSCHIFCVRLLYGHVHPRHVQYSIHGWNSLSLLLWQDSEEKLNALQAWLQTWAVRAGEYFKQPCCLSAVILTLVLWVVVLGEPHFFLVEKFEKYCSVPCHSSQSLKVLHTGPLKRVLLSALGHLYYLFLSMPLLTWQPLKVWICVCVFFQDASHPGPSPSSAGVPLPPKVASITSELLAHAKVQLPLNMWVHLRVPSAHPPVTWGGVWGSASDPEVCFSDPGFTELCPSTVKKCIYSLLCASSFLAPFHHFCNHIYSSASQGWNPHQRRKKIQLHSFP